MYRVVVVDDEPFMREGMRLMIDWADCGFQLVGEAASAQEALHLVDTLQPHLLITDMRMPGMSGADLSSIVRNYHPGTMMLFFSGYKDFEYAQSAIRNHAVGYLLKPIDPDEVHAALRRVKEELDARHPEDVRHPPLLRDHVLKRVAMGDDSTESIMRAGVLLNLKRDEPCYCAVLRCPEGAIGESAQLLISACGASPFLLAPGEFGLCLHAVERDLHMLERLLLALSTDQEWRISVGCVGRGAEGFAVSLREALNAQGVLFTMQGRLRVYHPFDETMARFLSQTPFLRLRDTFLGDDADALQAAISDCEPLCREQPAYLLRYLAVALDSIASSAALSPLHPLWDNDPTPGWYDAFGEALLSLQAARKPKKDDLPTPVQTVLSLLQTRYGEALSINGVAEELHMNPAYLGQLIRKHTGATFHQQLQETRIERACVLLRQTSRAVGEIALDVGFRDVDYFGLQFRGRVGMSPMAYRGLNGGKKSGNAKAH